MGITVYRSHSNDPCALREAVETITQIFRATDGESRPKDKGVDQKYQGDIELQLIRALRDGGLDMFQSAYAMATLIDSCAMTQSELALRLSLSQSAVANKLRLLRFSDVEKRKILSSALTERHARALLRLKDASVRNEALDRIIDLRLSVSESERLILSLSPSEGDRARRGKAALRDLRFFTNSIDRAVDLARQAGVVIEIERRESEGGLEIQIRVLKP